jgi:predicted dehydrogenase
VIKLKVYFHGASALKLERGMMMKNVRIGFIGAGWWATAHHMPLLEKRTGVELKAVCCLGNEALQKVQQRFKFPYATESYKDLLNQDLDAIYVCSPHAAHYEHARAALERGFHVLCEKPMTLHAREAWDLVRLAKAKGVHLLVPYGWNYKPFVQRARLLLQEGEIGRIESVACRMASPTKDFFSREMVVPAQFRNGLFEPDMRTWQVGELGGGYGHGQLTHALGILFWLTNLRAREVNARTSAPNSKVDMYDAATVLFQDGVIGTLHGAATLPNDDPFQIDIHLFGSEGVMFLSVAEDRLEVRRHDGRNARIPVSPMEGQYSCEGPTLRLIDLLQGLTTENNSSGELAARSVELIEAMYLSAGRDGGVVRIANEQKE